MTGNRRYLPIYMAAEDLKQGQIVCIDNDGNVRAATKTLVERLPFPTLEELKNYATLGFSINKVTRLHKLSSPELVRDVINQYPDLKTQFFINGKTNQRGRFKDE